MDKLERVLIAVNRMERPRPLAGTLRIDSRARLIVTLLYLCAVLSVPVMEPWQLVWLFVYPIALSCYDGTGYGRLLLRSLWIVPLCLLIGLLNVWADRSAALVVGGTVITGGWISCGAIVIRGVLSLQAVLLLIDEAGFIDVCDSLRRLGVPSVLTTQILMVYRNISVLVGEALTMKRARQARGYGRRSMTMKEWSRFVGQLLLRSVARARRIYSAMLARGFNGMMPPPGGHSRWNAASAWWIAGWTVTIAALRFVPFGELILKLR